ncbi:hypothetical protein COU56_05070 [Candidatus Pacearchaeota archaeon CG10_big_fil_rev_8_21_14_0_10_31_9]|nr:MAG: hypothetical protein AUJ62_03415 [Candidatus Pacearchaeota archaeon CG1_02_32_21]PIN91617.1 MAG: hypothetical protein COU56_05070 [Candidatus Pacearchaeota archaeon CG10_big_fil_rev_8_21_14_0_10_31_9]PIZ82923.1 MAG: hypothetical protein COX97_02285 [Candidatus Pacearchaeota archaeon CG_4_10_14_0_2_um_filter_05_32_18]
MTNQEMVSKIKELNMDKRIQFSGSSPPEIFIGRQDYPNVYAGVLSPMEYGNTEKFSSPENWFKHKYKIEQILEYRSKLIYSRFKTNIKSPQNSALVKPLSEIAMSNKSVSAEFFLEKPVKFAPIQELSVPIIGNPAPLKRLRLEENPKIEKSVDYVVSDEKLKSTDGIKHLYESNVTITNIVKVLSAGLLGIKDQRKMVPTRWAITAVDDTLSKELLEKIKYYPELSEVRLFHSEYLGNHYEILLIPDTFSFEVIEISLKNKGVWKDHESTFGRKKYAEDVTGAYYANRLAVCEYLNEIRRQAKCIFLREIRPEYNAPLGVGILREVSRDAFSKYPEKFQTTNDALKKVEERLKQPVGNFTNQSALLKEQYKQKKLTDWA